MGSMDSSADNLLPRPPPQAAELPAPPEGGGRRLLGKMSGNRLRAVAAMLLVSNYFNIVSRILTEASYDDDAPGAPLRLPWRLPAAVALAYAAAAAAFWFVGRLERRRLPDGHGARWEKGVKVTAHVLAHAILGVLVGYSGSLTPLALYVFMWVGSSRDHIYLGLEVHKEEGEEKPYEM